MAVSPNFTSVDPTTDRTECCDATTTGSIAIDDDGAECCRACYREVIR